MDDFELDELMDHLVENVKEDIKDYEDIISLDRIMNREIYLGDVYDGSGNKINILIRYWNDLDKRAGIPAEERKPIKIYIDSWGGSLTDCLTIVDSIEMSVTPVWTIAIGCCYSAGFFTLISGHRRIAYPHSSFLFHEGSTSGVAGTANQFEGYSTFYRRQLSRLKDLVLKHSNVDEDWYKDNKKDDVWFMPEEVLELGMVDEIAEEVI